MPEPILSEEEVNRQQWWCQFNVSGIRCSDCPGASTSHLQGRPRCQFHGEEHDDPDKERTGEAASPVDEARLRLQSSASSSSEVPEVESLCDEFSKLSLTGRSASETSRATPRSLASPSSFSEDLLIFRVHRLSLADPSASGSSTLAVQTDVGSKRKVDDSEEYKGQSIQEYLRTKPLKRFAEATGDVFGSYPRRRFLQHLMRVSEDSAAAIASSPTTTACIAAPLIVCGVSGVYSSHDDIIDMEID